MAFDPDLYVKALSFAGRAHGAQLTPIKLPYVVHVTSVCMELIRALEAEPSRDADLAVACALLHDVLEDTQTPRAELEAAFGAKVAAGVDARSKRKDVADPVGSSPPPSRAQRPHVPRG